MVKFQFAILTLSMRKILVFTFSLGHGQNLD